MAWDPTTRDTRKRSPERYECGLSDEERPLAGPLLPAPSKLVRRRAADLRGIHSATRCMLATRCRRRTIPKCFPPFAAFRSYFYRWRDNGVIERIMDALRELARESAGRSPEPAAAGIDRRTAKTPEVTRLWADSGHRGRRLRSKLTEPGVPDALEIVVKPRDIKGFTVLCRRRAVERALAWMSRCQRLAKDFERTQASSVARAHLAAFRFLARRLARDTSI